MSIYKMSSDQMMHFVELYRDRECLWNISSPLYKDRDAREAAMKEIAAEMNIEGFGHRETAQKIKNLRTTYNQERKKIALSKNSAATVEEIYKPRVNWFETVDAFLRNNAEIPPTTPIMNPIIVKMSSERFTTAEKDLLVNLVMEKKSVLENKKTDAVSSSAKVRSWIKIEEIFNSHPYVNKRPWKTLRKAWENIKARRKRAIAEELRQRMLTIGEPFISPKTESNPEIAIPSISYDIPNVGDSDMLQGEMDFSSGMEDEQKVCYDRVLVEKTPEEVYIPAASTSRAQRAYESRSAAAEKVLDLRMEKVNKSINIDQELHEKKMKAVELDIRLKEAALKQQEEIFKLKAEYWKEKIKRLKALPNTTSLEEDN